MGIDLVQKVCHVWSSHVLVVYVLLLTLAVAVEQQLPSCLPIPLQLFLLCFLFKLVSSDLLYPL